MKPCGCPFTEDEVGRLRGILEKAIARAEARTLDIKQRLEAIESVTHTRDILDRALKRIAERKLVPCAPSHAGAAPVQSIIETRDRAAYLLRLLGEVGLA